MDEILTLEEMRERYPGEWVLIECLELDEENLRIIRGRVLAHSLDYEEIYRQLPGMRGQCMAIEYLGEVPEDIAVVV